MLIVFVISNVKHTTRTERNTVLTFWEVITLNLLGETLFDIAIDNSYFATENSGKPGTELTLLNPARPFYMEEIPRLSVVPN